MRTQLEQLKDKEAAWAIEKKDLINRIENLEYSKIASEQAALFVHWIRKKTGLELEIKSVEYDLSEQVEKIFIELKHFRNVRDILANFVQKFNQRIYPILAAQYPNIKFIELLKWSEKYKLIIF